MLAVAKSVFSNIMNLTKTSRRLRFRAGEGAQASEKSSSADCGMQLASLMLVSQAIENAQRSKFTMPVRLCRHVPTLWSSTETLVGASGVFSFFFFLPGRCRYRGNVSHIQVPPLPQAASHSF